MMMMVVVTETCVKKLAGVAHDSGEARIQTRDL